MKMRAKPKARKKRGVDGKKYLAVWRAIKRGEIKDWAEAISLGLVGDVGKVGRKSKVSKMLARKRKAVAK